MERVMTIPRGLTDAVRENRRPQAHCKVTDARFSGKVIDPLIIMLAAQSAVETPPTQLSADRAEFESANSNLEGCRSTDLSLGAVIESRESEGLAARINLGKQARFHIKRGRSSNIRDLAWNDLNCRAGQASQPETLKRQWPPSCEDQRGKVNKSLEKPEQRPLRVQEAGYLTTTTVSRLTCSHAHFRCTLLNRH